MAKPVIFILWGIISFTGREIIHFPYSAGETLHFSINFKGVCITETIKIIFFKSLNKKYNKKTVWYSQIQGFPKA